MSVFNFFSIYDSLVLQMANLYAFDCTSKLTLRQPGDLSMTSRQRKVSLGEPRSVLVTVTKSGTSRAIARARCSRVIPKTPARADTTCR